MVVTPTQVAEDLAHGFLLTLERLQTLFGPEVADIIYDWLRRQDVKTVDRIIDAIVLKHLGARPPKEAS